MKPEEALDKLDTLKDCANVEVLITDKDVEAFKVAIQAINDGEVYMSGSDYDLYLEGYKQGLQDGQKDSKGPQGEWINTSPYDDKGECSLCCYLSKKYYKFCPNCGAVMTGGAE